MAATTLAGCYVISLRPVGQHDALRRAAARRGAHVIALSPCRLVQHDDAAVRGDLRAALRSTHVIVTSPAAVQAARTLQPLRAHGGQAWFAIGSATAQALMRAGIAEVAYPPRMDSEGLLALPGLHDVHGRTVGLVTAPGGRGMIERMLTAAGARILRAEVYRREPIAPAPRAVEVLRTLTTRPWLALSSGEALDHVVAALPADARAQLLRARVLAASARLAQLARAHGFVDVAIAASAQPRDLLAAAGAADGASASMRTAAAGGTP